MYESDKENGPAETTSKGKQVSKKPRLLSTERSSTVMVAKDINEAHRLKKHIPAPDLFMLKNVSESLSRGGGNVWKRL